MQFLLCWLLIVLLSQPHTQENTPLTIGFIPGGGESEWEMTVNANIREEAERRGIHLLMAEANAEQGYVNAFRSYIEQKVDAILVYPRGRIDWDDLLREAQAAGIPVVILGRPIAADESLYLTYVSPDFVDQGRLVAAWLAQATSGTCRIVELAGTAGSNAAMQRQSGFNDVIALFPQMEITASQTGDFMRSGGEAAMETILSTVNPAGICAVWAHNDAMALGAIDVLQQAGLEPGEDILIVSIDAEPELMRALTHGDTNATVELSPLLAAPAFDAIADYLAGRTVPKWIPVRGRIFAQENQHG